MGVLQGFVKKERERERKKRKRAENPVFDGGICDFLTILS